MDDFTAHCLEICENLRRWFQRHEYRGVDPYQLDDKVFKYQRIPFIRQIRSFLRPLHAVIPPQIFSRLPPILIPKALGLIISGNSLLYRVQSKTEYIEENYTLLELLEETRSPGYRHRCWGLPFEWGSNPRYPPHLPFAIVTSIIGHSLLDFYEVTKDDRIIEIAKDSARYLILENGYEDFGDSLCLYYSPVDQWLIHNANFMGASFLIRLSQFTGDQQALEFAIKAIRFGLADQNEDGSWHYFQGEGRVDNRHTGFVLEALRIANEALEDPSVEEALAKGWRYYRQTFFDGVIPRWSPESTHPVDIHDVAQAIITSVLMDDLDFAGQIVAWALEHFFDGQDQFYYKLLSDGWANQTVFLRWNQAWMYKALSLFVARNAI